MTILNKNINMNKIKQLVKVRIGLKNGGEMEGEVIHGVLHGKVLIRGKANALIFSGQLVVDVI